MSEALISHRQAMLERLYETLRPMIYNANEGQPLTLTGEQVDKLVITANQVRTAPR